MPVYKDIDLNFAAHPGTGDVLRIFDLEAVNTSIRNIVNGKAFEKPFDEHYGTTIRSMLFTTYSPMSGIIIKRILKEKIELYDPRVTINDVNIDSGRIDSNDLTVEIYYSIRGIGNQTLRLSMERLR